MSIEEKQVPEYMLTLYIAGASPNSSRAVSNIKKICNKYLKDKHEIEIIDIYQHPQIAALQQLVAVPLLVRHRPLPIKKLIGSMTDTAKVLKSLDLGEIK